MADGATIAGSIAAGVQRFVDSGETLGIAWGISIGEATFTGAAGRLESGPDARRCAADSVFRISSVSKPVTAVAALQLVDDGLIGLDDPLDAVLPELSGRSVLVDPTSDVDGATVAADRSITLRDLLSFRCGFGMDFDEATPQPVLQRMWEQGIGPGPSAPEMDPQEFLDRLSVLPSIDQPGTRWRYHSGSDLASVVVERLRGEPLDVVLDRDVCGPTGMADTGFVLRSDQLRRAGVCRMGGIDPRTGATEVWDEPSGRWASYPAFRSGATGLVSTVTDLLAFGQMILAGGAVPGGRVLSEALVSEMTADQLSDAQRRLAQVEGSGDALGWGLGLGVRHRTAAAGWPGPGCLGWDGGLGSRWVLDPSIGLCAVALSTDAFTSVEAPAVLAAFEEAIAVAL